MTREEMDAAAGKIALETDAAACMIVTISAQGVANTFLYNLDGDNLKAVATTLNHVLHAYADRENNTRQPTTGDFGHA